MFKNYTRCYRILESTKIAVVECIDQYSVDECKKLRSSLVWLVQQNSADCFLSWQRFDSFFALEIDQREQNDIGDMTENGTNDEPVPKNIICYDWIIENK